MVTATSDTKTNPAIAEIERLAFKWEEVADYDLRQLDVSRRIQVREPEHYAPKENVERYAIQMGETSFPPIVVTKDGWIVDGNTRVGAKLKRKEPFATAIVLDVRREGATGQKEGWLFALAATLNQTNGQQLTPKEVRFNTERFIKLGWKAEEIGRAIGVGPGTIGQVKREIAAVEKLQRVGLDPNGSLKGASLRALGQTNVVGLLDVPFRELASLATDSGFNASEITSTAKELRDLGSEQEAVERLARLRVEFRDRIAERRLTGSGRPPVARQLRQHLGFVTKFMGREQELIETDPNVGATHVQALDTAIAVLTEVRRMQVA